MRRPTSIVALLVVLVAGLGPAGTVAARGLSGSDVVGFDTNTTTGATVPVAKGVGTATMSVTVQGFTGSIPSVPVTVTGVGN